MIEAFSDDIIATPNVSFASFADKCVQIPEHGCAVVFERQPRMNRCRSGSRAPRPPPHQLSSVNPPGLESLCLNRCVFCLQPPQRVPPQTSIIVTTQKTIKCSQSTIRGEGKIRGFHTGRVFDAGVFDARAFILKWSSPFLVSRQNFDAASSV